MSETGISWTDRTWNPVTGCTRVSAGCDHCYAFQLHDSRYAHNLSEAKCLSGLRESGERHIRADESWIEWAKRVGAPPEGWTTRARDQLGVRLPFPRQYDVPFSRVQLFPERLTWPLRWKQPLKIFISMGDLFHEDVPEDFIDQVYATAALTPWHTYQFLTKRPERRREYLSDHEKGDEMHSWLLDAFPSWAAKAGLSVEGDWWRWPLPNVWEGTSCEDQAAWDARWPHLRATPAAVRFVSFEPLLGPIVPHGCAGLSWAIVGGESGPHFRPMELEWALDLRDELRAAGVRVWMKQPSGRRPETAWPAGIEVVREWPGVRA